MTTESQLNTDRLMRQLANARADAEQMEFDLPAPKAFERATSLLTRVAAATGCEDVEVEVAGDGSIEVYLRRGAYVIIVEIPSSGSRLQMVVQDGVTGAIVAEPATATEADVVKRIERAA
jgi:hypothetical protein